MTPREHALNGGSRKEIRIDDCGVIYVVKEPSIKEKNIILLHDGKVRDHTDCEVDGIITCTYDENGKRVFEPTDAEALKNQGMSSLAGRLSSAVQRLINDAIDDAKKKYAKAMSDDCSGPTPKQSAGGQSAS